MMNRRQEDRPLRVVMPGPPAIGGKTIVGLEVGEYEVDPRTGMIRNAPVSSAGTSGPCLFLLDSGEDDLVLVAGTVLDRIPRERPDLRERLLSRAVARHRAALHEARRLEALRRFVLLTERLTRVRTRIEVLDALSEHALAIVGGSVALVFSRTGAGSETWEVTFSPIPLPPEAATFAHDRLIASAPGLVSADAVPSAAPLLAATGASALAYASIGDTEILFIAERRSNRTFRADDWYNLRLLARQAEAALHRVRAA